MNEKILSTHVADFFRLRLVQGPSGPKGGSNVDKKEYAKLEEVLLNPGRIMQHGTVNKSMAKLK